MGGGGDTQTTAVGPPEFAEPFLETGLAEALGRFRQGPLEFFPDSTVVPQSEQTLAAIEQLSSPSGLSTAATDLVEATLRGDFLDPATNPFLQQTFDQAAQATRSQLDSQFAGAGRNLEAQLPARGDQLNQLATSIFGQNFQAERGRQQSLIPFVPTIDSLGTQNLLTAGGLVEGQSAAELQDAINRFQFNQQAPDLLLDQFLQRITGTVSPLGSVQTTQFPTASPLTGALGGAASGAGLGASIGAAGGPIGAGTGALLGSLIGLFG